MTTYSTLSFREFIQMVEKLGFTRVRQKGSHIRFKHDDGRMTTIPDHGTRDVPRGLLVKIVRYDLEMSIDSFFDV